MNKHNTLPNLMQKIVSDEEIQTIAEAVGYRDPSRTFTLRTLINFFLLAAVHQWKSFRHGADVARMHGLSTFHYSTVSKKAKKVPYDIMKRLFALMVSKCNRQTRRSLRFPKPLRVVDSTTVTVGKSRLPWAPYHGERAGGETACVLFAGTIIADGRRRNDRIAS